LLDEYRDDDYECDVAYDRSWDSDTDESVVRDRQQDESFRCGSFLLGVLTKEMDSERLNLFKNPPRIPYHKESLGTICNKVQVMDHLPWYDNVDGHARWIKKSDI
jgi:hypothetical protein